MSEPTPIGNEDEPNESALALQINRLCSELKGPDSINRANEADGYATPSDRVLPKVGLPVELQAKFGKNVKTVISGDTIEGYKVELSGKKIDGIIAYIISSGYPLENTPTLHKRRYASIQEGDGKLRRGVKLFDVDTGKQPNPAGKELVVEEDLVELKKILESAKEKYGSGEDTVIW
ncbi:MAG: hypothetical protein QG675_449 [Patescibacteria group bacterium]|jgi:hypothetical protein|nr:hypothetical protein [Patescibacteria group bacterium]